MVHWATWFGVSLLCGVAAFVIGEAVPFFGTLISLLAAIAYAPMAVSYPSFHWAMVLTESDCNSNASMAL